LQVPFAWAFVVAPAVVIVAGATGQQCQSEYGKSKKQSERCGFHFRHLSQRSEKRTQRLQGVFYFYHRITFSIRRVIALLWAFVPCFHFLMKWSGGKTFRMKKKGIPPPLGAGSEWKNR